MRSIVILISGRGSNMQAIVDACRAEAWPARIAAVVSDRADAAGLRVAADRGIATEVVDHARYAHRPDFDLALRDALHAHGADLVVMAGFMRVLGPAFIDAYAGRMLNVHPSLLPAFPGLHTHRAALQAGCKIAGLTVHVVTQQLDHGPIVAQAAVPVLPGDTEETLAARVLAQEHVVYPRAIRWWVEGRLRLQGGVVLHCQGEAQAVFYNARAHRSDGVTACP